MAVVVALMHAGDRGNTGTGRKQTPSFAPRYAFVHAARAQTHRSIPRAAAALVKHCIGAVARGGGNAGAPATVSVAAHVASL
jgi:hypothetical protein